MRWCLLSLLFLVCLSLAAQQLAPAPNWKSLDFLIGDWTGSGGGGPGQGSGNFSFHFDLEKQVVLRKNSADYPAANDRAAYHHEDLMVIHPDDQSNNFSADYFDSEGHVIRYRVQPGAPGGTAIFVSDAMASRPRYRLTYKKIASGVEGSFEIAPPGKPEDFKLYLKWTAAHDR
jgi:hypothetical protein